MVYGYINMQCQNNHSLKITRIVTKEKVRVVLFSISALYGYELSGADLRWSSRHWKILRGNLTRNCSRSYNEKFLGWHIG